VPESQRVRIEIGFDGGQVMSAYVDTTSADELEQALANSAGAGSFLIDAEDGRYSVALAKVVYVKRFSREGRVGFSDS
jgi:hypothetical protein